MIQVPGCADGLLTQKRRWVVALAFVVTSANAEVAETLDYDHYDIRANPNRQLGSLLNDASPFKENGRIFHAKTKWNIRWSFSLRNNGAGVCKVEAVSVALKTKVTLPRLMGDSARQQGQFARYYAALKHHELGHHQIAQEAAMAVSENLSSLAGNSSCADLSKIANAAAQQTVDGYNNKNRLYDIKTDHGKSQGARLVN